MLYHNYYWKDTNSYGIWIEPADPNVKTAMAILLRLGSLLEDDIHATLAYGRFDFATKTLANRNPFAGTASIAASYIMLGTTSLALLVRFILTFSKFSYNSECRKTPWWITVLTFLNFALASAAFKVLLS